MLKFFRQNLHQNGSPHTINIDKSKTDTAALVTLTQPYCFTFKIRQCQYKNNIVEQDHRFIKKRYRPMLRFKSFKTAQIIISGIKILSVLDKRQIPVIRGFTKIQWLPFTFCLVNNCYFPAKFNLDCLIQQSSHTLLWHTQH